MAHSNLGNAFRDQGKLDEAVAHCERAVALKPDLAMAHNNLGNALQDQGKLDDAMMHYERAIALKPDYAEAHHNLGTVFMNQGRPEEAIAQYESALAIKPGYVLAHRCLLLAALYHPSWSQERRFLEHRRFERLHAQPLYPSGLFHASSPDPQRKLRVGYFSSDLGRHPVGRNLLPVVEAHDREQVELIFYSTARFPDQMTARFCALADRWRSMNGSDDRSVAEAIRSDQIDVLVSLAGRFDGNQPLVSAHRPAPVQVSFHDPATSGLSVVDALIADRILVPRRRSEAFTERPIRLPNFYVHSPNLDAPAPSPLPMIRNGYPTFGSFNNPAKLNDETLALWAELLRRSPEAHLKLKYRNWFSSRAVIQRVRSIMLRHSIDFERIDLLPMFDDGSSHLERYNDIDVALDPFPFSGSTTTFEALWMGIPVVTLLGANMAGRWSASMLTSLNLPELIAKTPADYIRICEKLCSEPERLADLRQRLRSLVASSPLCNGRHQARHLERVYRSLWRKWCRERRTTPHR
jgi:predicted O-linked N-acetylglucosamine transferase (SPINDLY family)